MKKILLLVLAIVAASCKKDKDDVSQQNLLVGLWALQSITENGNDITGTCDEFSYIIFSEKEFQMHTYEGTPCQEVIKKGDYSFTENQLELAGQKFKYAITNNVLTLISPSGAIRTYKKNARKIIPETPKAQQIIGKWKLDAATSDGVEVILDDCIRQSFYHFTDKKLSVSWSSKNNSSACETKASEFDYAIEGNKIIDKNSNELIGSFVIEENKLTLSGVTDDSQKPIKYILLRQ